MPSWESTPSAPRAQRDSTPPAFRLHVKRPPLHPFWYQKRRAFESLLRQCLLLAVFLAVPVGTFFAGLFLLPGAVVDLDTAKVLLTPTLTLTTTLTLALT